MELEQSGIPATEVEWERVSAMVRSAYGAWSQDCTNPETIQRMNQALDEAYATGVRIAVKITQAALDTTDLFNPRLNEKILDLRLKGEDEIIIGSIEDIGPRQFKGQVVTKEETGYLSLDLYLVRLDYTIPFALFRPGEIASLTPIEPAK